MELGEKIKAYRREHNISQREFARRCNLSNGYISMLENGENPATGESISPTITILKSIAAAMCVSTTELLSECYTRRQTMEKNKHVSAFYISNENVNYVRIVAAGFGLSQSSLIDAIISSYRADHPKMYEKAMKRIQEVHEELEGMK